MLAALLLNLGGGPPPAPPAAAGRYGPALWWRPLYGCDDDDECERVEEIIEEAVEAIRTLPEPAPVVKRLRLDFEQVLRRVDGVVRAESRALFHVELERRARESEEDEFMQVLASIL